MYQGLLYILRLRKLIVIITIGQELRCERELRGNTDDPTLWRQYRSGVVADIGYLPRKLSFHHSNFQTSRSEVGMMYVGDFGKTEFSWKLCTFFAEALPTSKMAKICSSREKLYTYCMHCKRLCSLSSVIILEGTLLSPTILPELTPATVKEYSAP